MPMEAEARDDCPSFRAGPGSSPPEISLSDQGVDGGIPDVSGDALDRSPLRYRARRDRGKQARYCALLCGDHEATLVRTNQTNKRKETIK